MSTALLLYPILLSRVVYATSNSEQGPMNLAAKEGATIHMSCQFGPSSNHVDWYHTPVGEAAAIQKINDIDEMRSLNFEHCNVSGAIPGERLTIWSLNRRHAGLYTCTTIFEDPDIEENPGKKTAQVIVLATDPVCTTKNGVQIMENGAIEMTCAVNFSGNLAPQMSWTQSGSPNDEQRKAPNVTIRRNVTESSVSSTLTALVDMTWHGSQFRCRTFFGAVSQTWNVEFANNTISYEYTWTTPMIEVLYGPRNLSVTPRLSGQSFQIGDTLTCLADGNPLPQFHWTDMETGDITYGATLSISEDMARVRSNALKCTSSNSAMNKTVHLEIRIVVRSRPLSTLQIDFAMAIMIGCVILTIVAIVLFSGCAYVVRTKRERRRTLRENTVLRDQLKDLDRCTAASYQEDPSESATVKVTRARSFDNAQYLRPEDVQPVRPSPDYDEIPDATQSIATDRARHLENPCYLEIVTDSHPKPRPANEYTEPSDPETGPESGSYYEMLITPSGT